MKSNLGLLMMLLLSLEIRSKSCGIGLETVQGLVYISVHFSLSVQHADIF